ncbi:glutathione S-transferase family protein [Rhizobium halophytocola]|uniref:Glutathione S-transferase n=1 Tax=Rhizobium halophytocola TaxID=735519 RepID=A0ABS4DY74_9HYPH|nr:glutathione S-transferase family protein [Rhizobium halophytocola]MBP1850641.1 glutathione S-transferase [Rhizobium halophytocola]
MATTQPITFYYAPQTRATGVRVLLEELGAPHILKVLNFKVGEHRQPPYLAINPLGKVPAILHGETLVTEQVAIYLHLGDLFAEAGLTPAINDPDRGAYLRWIALYGSSFEPAVIDRHRQYVPSDPNDTPYGRYEDLIAMIEDSLSNGPYLLGERLTVADILWGMALNWTVMFGLVPERPAIKAYIARMTGRPAFQRVAAEDAALAAQHQAEADKAAAAS